MSRFEYRCSECGWTEAVSEPSGDDIGECPSGRYCGGQMRRVWGLGFLRSSCRAVPK